MNILSFVSKLFGNKNLEDFSSSELLSEPELGESDVALKFDWTDVESTSSAYLNIAKSSKLVLSNWNKSRGELVFAGEDIGTITSEDRSSFFSLNIKATDHGAFEPLIDIGDSIKSGLYLGVIRNSFELKKNDIRLYLSSKKSLNSLETEYVYFTSNLNTVSLSHRSNGFSNDSIIDYKFRDTLYSNSDYELYVSFLLKNLDPYIKVHFLRKHFIPKKNDSLSLLLESNDVVMFRFESDSERVDKQSDGVIYGIEQQIDLDKFQLLQKSPILKWKIEVKAKEKDYEGMLDKEILYSWQSKSQVSILEKINCLFDMKVKLSNKRG